MDLVQLLIKIIINITEQLSAQISLLAISFSKEDIKFKMLPASNSKTFIDVEIQTDTSLNIGSRSKFYQFEYRPNPVIKEILCRATILR